MKKLVLCFVLLLAGLGAFAQSLTYRHCGRLLDFPEVDSRVKNAREFAYLVEAGMSAHEALYSGPIVPAQMLGCADWPGSIAAGQLADIIAVPGDPLEDTTREESVDFVREDGLIYPAGVE